MGIAQKDKLFAIGTICVALLFGTVAFGYPFESSYFPRVLAVFVGLMATVLLIRVRLVKETASARSSEAGIPPQDNNEQQKDWIGQLKAAFITFAAILAYAAGIMIVNYEIATLAFLTILMLVLGYRNVTWIVVTAVGMTLLLYGVFFNFLAVARPISLFFS